MRNPFRRRKEPEQRNLDIPWAVEGSAVGTSRMDVDKALRLAPVYAAGRLLSSSVASLPLQTYRKIGDRRQRIQPPALFTGAAGDGLNTTGGTLNDWLTRCMTSLIFRGNAVGLINRRNYDEYPTDVMWLNPDEVQVQDSQPSGPGSFENPTWRLRGRVIPAENLVHIPWITLAGRVWGLSPMEAFASTVSTAFAAEDYSNDWFQSGGVPPGTFQNSSQTVDQQQAEVIKKRLVQSIRSHEPIVYGADWTYTPITVSQNEARFVDTMRLTATQIASIYGIPPEMIGGDTGRSMTYANTEQQAIHFVQFTLMPWLTKLESHFTALLPRGQYVKFNADALIRTDASTRYQNYSIARNIGLLSIDEIRALEDMEPLGSGAGASHTPLALLSADSNPTNLRERRDAVVSGEVEKLSAWEDERAYGGSTLPYGPGDSLWDYWTKGEGFAKWAGATHKWTTLHRLLIEAGVPRHSAKGLTTNIIQATMPGYLDKSH